MTSRKYIIGSLIAVAAVIIAVVLWQGFPLKQTGADRMVNAVNSMYSNVVFHDSAEYGSYRISAFTCEENRLGAYLIDNDGGGSGGASDEPECMVMFATEFDTDEFLIGVVDRGNAVKMDFKSIRCNDDGTESIDRSETFRLNKTGISAYLFAVPNAYERERRLVYTVYDKDGNVLAETADKI